MWRKENFARYIPYTGALLIPMGPAPDKGVWRDSIAAIVRRHEALHSSLAVVNDRAILIPAPQNDGLEMVKVSRFDIENYFRHRSALSEFFETPIDLLEEAGFRCRAFQDEDGNATLGILMHHYVGDAWSSQIVRREILAVQAARARGMAPDLPPAAQYSEYALSQRRSLAKNLPAQLAYWQQHLAGARPTELPFDRSGDANRQGRALFSVSGETLAKLIRLSHTERISLSTISLAAFQAALAQWCGQTQAVTAMTSADRMNAQFQGTVGRLIGGIAIYSDFPEDMPIREFLSALAKQFYGAILHQDLAFEQYDEIFSPPALFCPTRFNFIPQQAEFATVGDGASMPKFPGVLRLTDTGRGEAYSDLLFVLIQYPDGLLARVTHSLDFSAEKINSFIDLFGRILEKIADNPGGSVNCSSGATDCTVPTPGFMAKNLPCRPEETAAVHHPGYAAAGT